MPLSAPRGWTNSSARRRSRNPYRSRSTRRSSGASRWIIRCSSGRPGLARPLSPSSWRRSWASTSAPRPVRCSSARAISSACSPRSVRATSCSSTRCTGYGPCWKSSSIRQWRTTGWTSGSPTGRTRKRSPWRWSGSRMGGATTRFGLLTPPMRARFGLVERLAYYPPDDLAQIISRSAGILDVPTDAAGITEIARRSRGTPRVANRLLKRVRDYAQVRAGGKITAPVAAEALKRLDVDEFGLDDMDGRILKTIIEQFECGPVGLTTIAAAVGEDPGTLEEVYEPFLMQQGFLARTPRGRCATAGAYKHFGFTPPRSSEQPTMFDG